jgi:Rrf2 family protein
MFSKTCEHAIKSIIFVAGQSLEGKRANLKEIASGIESPVAFTAKILQVLAKNNFIYSIQGAYGGFEMEANKMHSVTLMQVVMAVDGDDIIHHCVLGLKQCTNANPCPFHENYAPIRKNLIAVMEKTTIYDLATGLKTGRSLLKQ